MAARGGRGGGRGGRGGKPGVFTPQLLGHLAFADIIEQSKIGTDVLYPPVELPDTELSSSREARIAKRYNSIRAEMKFTPYWVPMPTKQSQDIERYSDRFKPAQSSTAPGAELSALHAKRKYPRELLPSSAWEVLFEKKKRRAGAEDGVSAKQKQKNLALALGRAEGGEDDPARENEDSASEAAEEEGELEPDEEEEEENDYEDNYFDNGEDDGMDDLGGGGDDEGGTFD